MPGKKKHPYAINQQEILITLGLWNRPNIISRHDSKKKYFSQTKFLQNHFRRKFLLQLSLPSLDKQKRNSFPVLGAIVPKLQEKNDAQEANPHIKIMHRFSKPDFD